MKQRLYDFIPVKHLCVGMSLCGIVAGTQTAQASPVFGQSSGLELPSPSIYQQSTKQISGIVKDQAGIPVIGANVIVKGTTNGVITGLDGDFLLEVPENAILEISYIGYMTQSIPINGKTTFNIILAYIIHSGFISGYQNRYGDNLKPPTNVYHRMTA